ncbi:MAG: hypothetical protein ACRERX_02235 [Pseudomonas sp.]
MSTQQILGGNTFAPGQTAGQAAGSIVGAVIGAMVGGPAGAFTGYQIGAEIPGTLDPAPDQQDRGAVSKHLSEGVDLA